MLAYVSIIDQAALTGMKGDVMTTITSVLGVIVAVAAVGIVIKVLQK